MSTPQADAAARLEVQARLGAPPAQGPRAGWLLEYLHRLDEQWGGLHAAHLAALAQALALPLAQVQAVAAGCGRFAVLAEGEQPAPLRLTICDGLPCQLAGAAAVRAQLPALLPDGVALAASGCLGRCPQAPTALVGQVAVAPADGAALLNTVLREVRRPPGAIGLAPGVEDFESYEAYRAGGGYGLAVALANGHEEVEPVLRTLDAAGLQDADGAVAPRWRQARTLPAPRRLVVDLARGEPGAFGPRQQLEREPHRFLDGVLIAAQVVGADTVAIDLDPAWHDARVLLQGEIARLRANRPFPQPVLELQRGAALRWGELAAPAVLPQPGEPLIALRALLERDAGWYALHPGRALRSFSVSGRVRSPGLKLAPAGISLRQLLEEHCDGLPDGQALYAWLPGTATGGVLPASLATLPLDALDAQAHGAALGAGGIVVLGAGDRARDAVLASLRHLADAGRFRQARSAPTLARAVQLLEAPRLDGASLRALQQALAEQPGCAYARAAATSLRCLRQHFSDEIA